jgi:hypothetical protein
VLEDGLESGLGWPGDCCGCWIGLDGVLDAGLVWRLRSVGGWIGGWHRLG